MLEVLVMACRCLGGHHKGMNYEGGFALLYEKRTFSNSDVQKYHRNTTRAIIIPLCLLEVEILITWTLVEHQISHIIEQVST